MASIGIMGGTFNPIHNGHLTIAKAAYEQYHLDEIWVMPNHIPAYKSEDSIVSGEMRLEMVQIAIKDIPYCRASDFELKRDGNTYTIDTLKLLKKQYPEHAFYFIMGADSLFDFRKWKDADQIPEYATILVAPRDEKSKLQISEKIDELNAYYEKECFQSIECTEIPCSSSDIRSLFTKQYDYILKERNVWEKMYLTKEVYQYIVKHDLYTNI